MLQPALQVLCQGRRRAVAAAGLRFEALEADRLQISVNVGTPNTWALEAYTGVFWRGETVSQLWLPWTVLGFAAIAGWWISRRLARRMESV